MMENQLSNVQRERRMKTISMLGLAVFFLLSATGTIFAQTVDDDSDDDTDDDTLDDDSDDDTDDDTLDDEIGRAHV